MKIRSKILLAQLEENTRRLIVQAKHLQGYSLAALTFKEAPENWDILECLAHLNLYGDFYLPELGKRIKHSRHRKEEMFHSGVLGNYFAQSMLPKKKLNKMKTFKSMNPLNASLDKNVIDIFLNQQDQMLKLLKEAREVSLNKTKTSISISSLIKLKLGDTFRIVIYHNQRHAEQIDKILKAVSKNSGVKNREVETDLSNF